MFCPTCGSKLGCYDTEKIEPPINTVIRKRDCLKCGVRYTTMEKITEQEQLSELQVEQLKLRGKK